MPQERLVTVEDLLDAARMRLRRLAPQEVQAALGQGAELIDIRSDSQRARDGVVPGAQHIPRNVLEWRLDPASAHRDHELSRRDAHVVLMCDEGFQSSLAAATLQRFGLRHATDMAGGFQAWRAAGLPIDRATSLKF